MTTEPRTKYSKTSTEADPDAEADYVAAPRIDIADPENFYHPREFFAKRLINSPVEFGTLSHRRTVAPEDGGPGNMEFGQIYEIDLAVHLHHGALVCGFVSAGDGPNIEERIEKEVQVLSEARRVLIEALEDESSYYDDVPPIGLYIALYGADNETIPDDWEAAEAWISPETGSKELVREMVSAMKWWDSDREVDQERWSWLAVGLRSVADRSGGFESALEMLVRFEAV